MKIRKIRLSIQRSVICRRLRVKPAMTGSRDVACRVFIVVAIFCVLFFSCDPKMEVPSYIWIDSVDFQVLNPAQQGTASHRITDVRVFANGQSLGFYQLPARIPILENGDTKFNIHAGIMIGGVPQTKAEYPFYTPYVLNVNLKKGEIDTLLPYFTYTDSTKFWSIEDFESAGSLYTAYETSAPLMRTSEDCFVFHHPKELNNYSGIVELPYHNDTLGDIYHFEIRTVQPINLNPYMILYCLMEINFRITHDVEVGMIVHSANPSIADRQVSLANLTGYDNINNTSANDNVWRKVYVNFIYEILENSSKYQMENFDVYIRATIPKKDKARFLFDNIKIVYNTY